MLLFSPSPLIPKPLRRTYAILRVVLFIALLYAGLSFAKSFLFPSQDFAYSFESQTAKNTLPEPTLASEAPIRQGHVPKGGTIVTYAGTYGDFTSLTVTLTLKKDSAAPDTIPFSARKSYRSFFAQGGDPITAAPKDRAFSSGGKLYSFDGEKLRPFLSDSAALSRFDRQDMTPASDDLLRVFPPENTLAGFRVGSLLSNTEGVFAVTSDEEIRAIGSTDIFRALGFDWNTIIKADEEELQFYRKGRIMLFDAEQPDGTLFRDRTTGNTYLLDGGRKRLIEDAGYASFLSKKSTPIEVSEKALETPAPCTLDKHLFSLFGATYSCTVPLSALDPLPGGSYALSLEAPDDLHIASIGTTFETDLTRDNLSIIARRIRDRFAARFQQ
jgi:hypothetical protein